MSLWTFIIDGDKAKLKLTTYKAMTGAEWDRMIESLQALKNANVVEPVSREFLTELEARQAERAGLNPDTIDTIRRINKRNAAQIKSIRERWADTFWNTPVGMSVQGIRGPFTYQGINILKDEEARVLQRNLPMHDGLKHAWVRVDDEQSSQFLGSYVCGAHDCPARIDIRIAP